MVQPSREKVAHHKCPNVGCGRVYAQLRDLNRHLKYRCGKSERFKCAYCDFKSHLRSSARRHVKRMHPTKDITVIDLEQQTPTEKKRNEFECTNCKRAYKTKEILRIHVQFICGKEKTVKCKYCPYKSHLRAYVTKHIKNRHAGQEIKIVKLQSEQSETNRELVKRFKCPTEGCTHSYVRKAGLMSHLKWVCRKEKYFKCPMCTFKGYYKDQVAKHTRNAHQLAQCEAIDLRPETMKEKEKSTVKRHKCPKANCDKAYSTRYNLYRHQQFYCGKEPGFKCEYCPYATYTRGSLDEHMQILHKDREITATKSIPEYIRKKYNCPIPGCTVAYESKAWMVRHLKYGCPAALSYKCPYCPLKSLLRRRIHDHIKTFHVERVTRVVNLVVPEESVDPNKKEYECPNSYCRRRYKFKRNLTKHLREGCYETPNFQCKYCPFKDFHAVYICEHIKHMHRGKPVRVINLKRAKINREKNTVLYKCPNEGCSCVYKTKKSFRMHLKYICGKPPRYGCPHCPYKYYRRDKVRDHMEKKHKDMNGDVIEFMET